MKRFQLMLVVIFWMFPAIVWGQGLWERMYSNPAGGMVPLGNHSVVTSWDPQFGGLVGYLTDFSTSSSVRRCFYVRLDTNGDTVWTKSTIFNKNHTPQNSEDVKSICRLPNGDFMISALCDTLGYFYFHLKRIDSMGNSLFLKVDFPASGAPMTINVVAGPNGGYYVVKNRWEPAAFPNYVIAQSKTYIERYNSNNVIVARDSFIRSDYRNYYVSPCATGNNAVEFSFPNTTAVLPSADGGLFWVFQQDSSAIFSPASCGFVSTGAVPGGYVHKYDSSLHLQWRTLLTPTLQLQADSQFVPAYAFQTSDSGIVIAGQVLDTPGMLNHGLGLAVAHKLVKLNKLGLVTDTLSGLFFGCGTETSSGNILAEILSNDFTYGKTTMGLCLLDKHFRLLRFTPHPFQSYTFHSLAGLRANQQGGAFAPCFIDTSANGQWQNPIPAAISCDSLLYRFPAFASGNVIRDLNANCSYEASIDKPIPNRVTQLINTAPNGFSSYAFTDRAGNWSRALPNGNYDIKHTIPANSSAVCPGPNGFQAVNLNTSAPSGSFDFFDTLKTNYMDTKVLLSSTAFVPGFTRQLHVYATNNGGATSSDTLRVVKPSILNYISASPSPTSISGNTLTWVLNNIVPDSVVNITVNLTTPSTASISTPLLFSGAINGHPDSNPNDNYDTLETEVVGSLDPNCKTINRPTYTTAQKDWIYTIEFQNTGNYPAQDVLITDKLDSLLDLTTIRLLHASHGTPQMEFQDGRELLFRFHNIYLQDSIHNEPASHGSVTFSVRPLTNIIAGNYISNSAAIYFDFNAPILTNSTYNVIAAPSAIPAEIAKQQHFSVYPNPANKSIAIQSSTLGDGVLIDMQGRTLLQFRVQIGSTNIRLPEGLTSGVYILQARSKAGEAMGVVRLVVR